MSKIKNIIFDLGEVIISQPQELMYTVMSEVFPEKKEEAYQLWLLDRDKTILGEISTEQFLMELRDKLDSKITIEQIRQRLLSSYAKHSVEVNIQLLDYIKELRTKYKVYMLTDTIDLHDEFNKTRDIYSQFDHVFKSFVEHTRKPERAAFENVLKKIHAKADECVFIDDLEGNVSGAVQIGMKGIVYSSFDKLKKQLEEILI